MRNCVTTTSGSMREQKLARKCAIPRANFKLYVVHASIYLHPLRPADKLKRARGGCSRKSGQGSTMTHDRTCLRNCIASMSHSGREPHATRQHVKSRATNQAINKLLETHRQSRLERWWSWLLCFCTAGLTHTASLGSLGAATTSEKNTTGLLTGQCRLRMGRAGIDTKGGTTVF